MHGFENPLLFEDGKKDLCFHEVIGFEKYGDFIIDLADLQNNLDLIIQAA